MLEAGVVNRRLVELDQGLFTSSTGEISLDAKRQRSKCLPNGAKR